MKTNNKPVRVRLLSREPATYIKLRRFGYSITTIARAFGRNVSTVHRYLKVALKRGILKYRDLRKIPNHVRRISKAYQWKRMLKMLPLWEAWILGESEKPP